MRGDGHGGGQPGGPDAADGDVAQLRVLLDPVVLVAGGRPQPRVDGGDLLVDQPRQDAAPLLPQQREPFLRRLGGGLVVELLRGGAEQHVAEDGRCHQDALAGGGGDGEQDVADEVAGELVVDDELSAARCDGEGVVPEEAVDLIGVQSGGVDQRPGAERAAGGGQGMDTGAGLITGLGAGLDGRDAAVQVQVDAGQDRLGGEGERGGPRTDDGLVGNLQRTERARPQVRFDLGEPARVQQPGGVVAVALGLGQQARERVELFLVPGDEEGADAFDGDARLGRVHGESALPLADQPGLQRTGHGVETGVQDRGVGLGRAVADVVRGLDECGTDAVAGQFTGDGGAHHSGADDRDVVVLALGKRLPGPGDGPGHRPVREAVTTAPEGCRQPPGIRRAARRPRRGRSSARTPRPVPSRAPPGAAGAPDRGRAGPRRPRRAR